MKWWFSIWTRRRSPSSKGEGMKGATDLEEFVGLLAEAARGVADGAVGRGHRNDGQQVRRLFEPGDILIDGGNSYFKDDVRRAKMLQDEGHPVCGCGHERRRLGTRARILPDGGVRAGRFSHVWSRSSKRWRREPGDVEPTPGRPTEGRTAHWATCTAGRTAPGIS